MGRTTAVLVLLVSCSSCAALLHPLTHAAAPHLRLGAAGAYACVCDSLCVRMQVSRCRFLEMMRDRCVWATGGFT